MNTKASTPDMHDEAWWLRAMDGDLSQSEYLLWEDHLDQCEACRREWKALMGLDSLLRTADPPPILSKDFTTRTVTRILRQQLVQRLVSSVSSIVIILFVSLLVLQFLGSAFTSVERTATFVIAERQILLNAFVQTLLGLLASWKVMFPLMLGVSFLAFLFLMPNGVATTLLIFWLARRRFAYASVAETA
ncbi:MAG: hypothetical protein JXA21_12135 [Anaerolineae bacterium]|nr:hypothetical protein [Anaerolineae bacterium]